MYALVIERQSQSRYLTVNIVALADLTYTCAANHFHTIVIIQCLPSKRDTQRRI